MLKYAFFFLIVSIVAGAVGFTGISQIARRISFALFGILFVIFLILLGIALLVDKAVQPALAFPPALFA
ncbi:MAG TPA: DUF1328 domain-containing protein [Xanthobacteraceae bacterium]|nr:DUF1328 domain-containing protein [Xanthobacteraceae bacterium]